MNYCWGTSILLCRRYSTAIPNRTELLMAFERAEAAASKMKCGCSSKIKGIKYIKYLGTFVDENLSCKKSCWLYYKKKLEN